MGARFPSTGGGIGDTSRALGSLVNVGSVAPGSGAAGDLFLVRSDGTAMRFTPPDVYASAWGLSTSASAAANTTALQAAGAAAAARKATLVLSDGTFNFNGVQFQNQLGLRIRGAGCNSTILQMASAGIGLDFFGAAGTGSTSRIAVEDLQVTYTAAGVTAVRFWNVQPFSVRRCTFTGDKLAMSVQGSYVGSVEDTQLYLQGSNVSAIGALWLGSGKTAPHTGAATLSGNGNLRFDSCVIEAFNGPAVIVEDNTTGVKFTACELEAGLGAAGAFNGAVEIDSLASNTSLGAGVTFERCYQEGTGATTSVADFALGTYEGHCNRVTIRGYESTGSGATGQGYAVDVAACDHLIVEQLNCINYTSGVVRFRTGYLSGLVGNTKAQLRCEQIDNAGGVGPIYVDADAHIGSAYRGPIVRTNTWKHVLTRTARLDAAVVTATNTYQLCNVNDPTAARISDPNSGLAWFYFDPADYGYAPLRVRFSVLVNATAPGVDITAGLVPVSGSPAGGAATVTQDNGVFIMTGAAVVAPAATSRTTVASDTAYITAPGWYALAVTPAGAFTASSSAAVTARLEAMN